jgi:hypothetical protein
MFSFWLISSGFLGKRKNNKIWNERSFYGILKGDLKNRNEN